jgi:hypothetical protein
MKVSRKRILLSIFYNLSLDWNQHVKISTKVPALLPQQYSTEAASYRKMDRYLTVYKRIKENEEDSMGRRVHP